MNVEFSLSTISCPVQALLKLIVRRIFSIFVHLLQEMWALFDFVCQGQLLGTSRSFKQEYENPIVRVSFCENVSPFEENRHSLSTIASCGAACSVYPPDSDFFQTVQNCLFTGINLIKKSKFRFINRELD